MKLITYAYGNAPYCAICGNPGGENKVITVLNRSHIIKPSEVERFDDKEIHPICLVCEWVNPDYVVKDVSELAILLCAQP